MSGHDQRCDTCVFFALDQDEGETIGLGWCCFPKSKLPTSADTSFVFTDDGGDCPCWEPKA